MLTKKIRVLVADDQQLVRCGIEVFLSNCQHIEIVGFATNPEETLSLYELFSPDILLLDLIMPDNTGLNLAKKIINKFPNCKIILLTMIDSTDYITEAILIGIKGYLLKSTLENDLIWSIHLTHRGYSSFKNSLLQQSVLEQNKLIKDLKDRNILLPKNSYNSEKKANIKIIKISQKLLKKNWNQLLLYYLKISEKFDLCGDQFVKKFCYWLDRKLFK